MGAPPPTELPVRFCTPQDWDAVSRLLLSAFHVPYDPSAVEREHGVFEPERTLVVTDSDQVVASCAALTRELTVPGGVLPASHLSMAAVAATHRRRRLLSRLMRRHLADAYRSRREPIAVLWASEGRIYRRFGFGLASQRLQFEIDTRDVRLVNEAQDGDDPEDGRLRDADPAAVLGQLCAVYERVRPARPGWSSRDERWWTYVLADAPARRLGGTELRALTYESDSGVDGYVLWRTRSGWTAAGSPQAQAWVVEMVAATPQAYRALWRFLLHVDLTRAVRFHFGAVDEPLLHLVDEPRALGAQIVDAHWLRLVDVGAALAARRYATQIDLVLEVEDGILGENAGRWRLTGDAMGASCSRTSAPADLRCDVAALGAAYLGGTPLGALAAAGLVHERRRGALAVATAAFGWRRSATAVDMF